MSTRQQEIRTDVCLIGAGPIGIEMAVALKSSGFDYLHFEAGALAATIAWYSPGTTIFSSPERLAIADVPFSVYPQARATREEYLAYLRDVAHQKQLKINTYSRVVSAQKLPDGGFCCKVQRSFHGVGGPAESRDSAEQAASLGQPLVVLCRRIILTMGNMHLPNRLEIPGEDLPHVSHFLGETHLYSGQKIVIVGGKNSAVEAAVRLALAHAKVCLCYHKEELDSAKIKPWLLPHFRSLQREGRIEFRNLMTPLEILSDGVNFKSSDGGLEKIECERVLLLTGYIQRNEIFTQLGVELNGINQAPRHAVLSMETNVKGVFVAGTASVGTQIGGAKAFIETTHADIEKIMKALGAPLADAQAAAARLIRPEADWES